MRTESTSDARQPPTVIEYLVNCDSDSSGDYQRRYFENGVPGVTMLTVVAAERKRRVSRPRPLCRLTVTVQ
jgi:hypothetical protein